MEAKHIKTLDTKNRFVNFNLEFLKDKYIIYKLSYDTRVDYVISNKEEHFMLKILQFLVDTYNDGFVDGKNSAILPNDENNINFNLELIDGDYTIYQISYGERIDYLIYDKDEEFMLKLSQFLTDSYKDGFRDGKNSTIFFTRF